MELQNYTEIMIDHLMEAVLKNYNDICKCDKCLMDIKAIALNNLPPRYVVSDKGELYKKVEELDTQIQVDVIRAITKAIEQVRNNKRHK
ncbi:MAG: late competence development ComFB family protein [Bacillota bacterium]|nr:late competence development ComFB family protein [Bacillota bacterium]